LLQVTAEVFTTMDQTEQAFLRHHKKEVIEGR